MDGLEWLHVKDVVGIVQRWLLVVKGREAHSFKMSPVPLLSTHHHPHGRPLGDVHRLDHPRDLVHEGDGPGDVVQALFEEAGQTQYR